MTGLDSDASVPAAASAASASASAAAASGAGPAAMSTRRPAVKAVPRSRWVEGVGLVDATSSSSSSASRSGVPPPSKRLETMRSAWARLSPAEAEEVVAHSVRFAFEAALYCPASKDYACARFAPDARVGLCEACLDTHTTALRDVVALVMSAASPTTRARLARHALAVAQEWHPSRLPLDHVLVAYDAVGSGFSMLECALVRL